MRRPELHFFAKSAIIPRQDPFFFGIRHDGAQHTRVYLLLKIRIEGLDQHSTTGRRRVAIRIGRQQARSTLANLLLRPRIKGFDRHPRTVRRPVVIRIKCNRLINFGLIIIER